MASPEKGFIVKVLEIVEHPEIYPGLPEHKAMAIALRIWRYPSFTPYTSWNVIRTKKNELYLRRIICEKSYRGFIKPDCYGSEVPLERSLFDEIMTKLQSLKIAPFFNSDGFGLDGTRYGVAVGDWMSSSLLSWWEQYPENWQPLQKWHEETVNLFESLLPPSSARNAMR